MDIKGFIEKIVDSAKAINGQEIAEALKSLNVKEVIENAKTIITKQYFCFEGCADRKEFWQWTLIPLIVFIIAPILALIPIVQFVSGLLVLAILLPTLGVTARRLHAVGLSGWVQLLYIIPILGLIVLILCYPAGGKDACCCCEGEK